MRVLHPIKPDETLLYRGKYTYYREGLPTGDIESFLITRLPDGGQLIRADIDGQGSGQSLVTQMKLDAEGKPERLRLRYRTETINAAAQYTFEEADVRVARRAEDHLRQIDLVEIAKGYVVDYHPVIAHTYVWKGYPKNAAGAARSIPIFSPDLWEEGEGALSGRALRFNIEPLVGAPCETPVGEYYETQHFTITLSDGEQALAWFDEEGIPLRWYYVDKGYDFMLTSFQKGGSSK